MLVFKRSYKIISIPLLFTLTPKTIDLDTSTAGVSLTRASHAGVEASCRGTTSSIQEMSNLSSLCSGNEFKSISFENLYKFHEFASIRSHSYSVGIP